MTQASVQTETTVEVSTWTTAYNHALNQTVSLLTKYAAERGLDTSHLTEHRDVIEDGFHVWMTGRHLAAVHLEVYDPGTDEVVERLDVPFEYTPPDAADEETRRQVQEQQFEALHGAVIDQVRSMEAPPDGCRYRVVVALEENEAGKTPPAVDGWTETSLRSVDHLDEEDLGGWLDGGIIEAAAALWHGCQDTPGVTEA